MFRNTERTPQERARDLLSRLTLREKVGQLNQRLHGFACYRRDGDNFELTEECLAEMERWGGLGVLCGLYRADPRSGRDEANGVPPRLMPKLHNLVQRAALERSRFGIPVLMSSESPHGHLALGGYLLPPALAMAATFDPALVQSAFGVCGAQMRAQGVDLALAPVLDVLRDPRWGRSEECFGEDPNLCAAMSAAAVRGVRGAGVDAVAKHLCAQGEAAGGVNGGSARTGQRELEEIYLPPVAAACAAGAKGFMVACHAPPALLRDYLRDALGFTGIVMADGNAPDRLDPMAGPGVASTALALESGVDLGLWDDAFPQLEEAVAQGLMDEARVDEAALRVLTLKFERGLFERPFLDEEQAPRAFSIREYPQSLELARRGAVLLKNEKNRLPLTAKPGVTIAVIGPNANAPMNQLGDCSPPLDEGEGVTLLEGVRRIAEAQGATVVATEGSGILYGTDEAMRQALLAAKRADVVILALGGSSSRYGGARFGVNGAPLPGGRAQMDCGEGVDCADLQLPRCQRLLIGVVSKALKPMVAVINAGRPYAIGDVSKAVDALVYSFYPGPWGGQALAEMLFGHIPPGGRLPASLPREAGYGPTARYDAQPGPLHRFGAGLGYTQLAYSGFDLTEDAGGALRLAFTVTNTGGRDGWAVPMLYRRAKAGERVPPSRELCGFARVWLEPGQSSRVEIATAVYTAMRHTPVRAGETAGLWLEENAEAVWSLMTP